MPHGSQEKFLRVIDSHTGGEPTRLVVEGLPTEVFSARFGSVAERLHTLTTRHDWIRRSLCNEPRGSEVMVGAVLVEPSAPDCDAAIIFFNNVGYLGMCGHGTIGLVASLAWMKKIKPGLIRIDTPVGVVEARLHADGHQVTLTNVPSFRLQAQIPLEVPALGRTVHGDLAWGGNWFFLVEDHGLSVEPQSIPALMQAAQAIQAAINAKGLTALPALNGGVIDHIELFGPPTSREVADSRSFVLCPGAQYDRSPCGTGTSAKLACLAASGKLKPGQTWRQESVIGSLFTGSVVPGPELHGHTSIIPTITGSAFVNADARFLYDSADPFANGI